VEDLLHLWRERGGHGAIQSRQLVRAGPVLLKRDTEFGDWPTDAWFPGTVSTFSSGSTVTTGYAKSYNYNRALRYRESPYFIAPTESAWKIVRQNEQVPAR
jgi:hypothetical protein